MSRRISWMCRDRWASSPLINVYSRVNFIGNQNIKAFEGLSAPAEGYGVGGRFVGGLTGVEGISNAGAFSNVAFGTFGQANGTAGTRVGAYGNANGTNLNYGVYGVSLAGSTNYGVYGYVNGGAGNFGVFGYNGNLDGYAGYFSGRGHFTQELRADRNLIVDDTTWTRRIWNQTAYLDIRSLNDIEFMIDRENGVVTGFFEIFNGTGAHVFYVSESGNSRTFGNHFVDDDLGIGTTSPVTTLHVATGTDLSLTGLGYMQNGLTSGLNMVLDNNEILVRDNGIGSDFFVQHDGGNLLLCGLEQGSVGIGVTSSGTLATGYLLSVDGKIMAEEMRIQNSTAWPDYVFSDEYPLLPLESLKTSIQQNKHLPNIPPAAQVETEGILVGDMQVRMMEKIEELTLYIIQLHDTQKLLLSEIERLKLQIGEKDQH